MTCLRYSVLYLRLIDPVIALLQSKYNLKIALSCPHFAESLVKVISMIYTLRILLFLIASYILNSYLVFRDCKHFVMVTF